MDMPAKGARDVRQTTVKRWLSVLAIAGILLHATALVKHAVTMAASGNGTPAISALLADATIICHSSSASSGTKLPGQKQPAKSSCPLCSGLAPLAALEAVHQVPVYCPQQRGLRLAAADVELVIYASIRPNSRGPPQIG